MTNQSILIGVIVVIFFVGLGIGYIVQTSNPSATIIHDLTVETNLSRFDELDFEAFSKQDWELFNQIHSPDVLVVFPDGRETRGIEQHDKDIMAMFVYAPDTRVTSHPIKFGSGQWTTSTGILEGTFSEPMPLSDGSSIPPTGKSFKVTMATIARWDDGRIAEEHLFWDNAEIMKQMGLGQ
jgi:ketosteroid isomerase-like protein